MSTRLTLGELALLAGAFEAELLAFAFAGVAAKQVGALEGALEVFVHDDEGFGDTEADSFDLAFVAATGYNGADIKLADVVEHLQMAAAAWSAGICCRRSTRRQACR